MKIELKDLTPVRKQMAVEVEPDEVAREHGAVLRRFVSQVKLPGFRPGKAPASLVRTRFAKEIDEDVRDRLLSRLYREAAQEKGLRPLGDPVLESNLTRRVDFALFMVDALENDELVHEAPAIVGRLTPSALTHAGSG